MVRSCWRGLNHNSDSKCFLSSLGSATNSEECRDLPAEREMLQIWLDPIEILVPLQGIKIDLSRFLYLWHHNWLTSTTPSANNRRSGGARRGHALALLPAAVGRVGAL